MIKMEPTKEQLIQHLSEKMTNQNIAEIYRITYQKVIQLIKKYGIDQNKLRKVDQFVVYEHYYNEEIVYVGSGNWYRMRRYTNRRNPEHRRLMKEGKLKYRIVEEFEQEDEARKYESKLIQQYKKLGKSKFNKQSY